MRNGKIKLAALCLILFLTISIQPQAGGNFEITQSTVSGGGQNVSGGTFSLDGTIGQPIAGGVLSGDQFSVSSGFWNFNSAAVSGFGLEGDTAPRPSGDGLIQSSDVVQIRRFLIFADTPDPNTNEFQRADSAPYDTKGDGIIQSNDVVQARRYLITADTQQEAGGPMTASGLQPRGEGLAAPYGPGRQLRVESTSSSAGQQVTVNIRVDAVGDESEYGFAVNYNPSILTNPTTQLGNAGALFRSCSVNPTGRLNCSVGTFPNNNPMSSSPDIGEIGAGNNQILITVTFTVAANAPAGATPVTLTNVNASNDAAQSLAIGAADGQVNILGPTAAKVTAGGRVITAAGRGISGVLVTIIEPDGNQRTTTTNPFGYYLFQHIEVGNTYIFTVSGKRYSFGQPTQVRFITDSLTDIDFVSNQ